MQSNVPLSLFTSVMSTKAFSIPVQVSVLSVLPSACYLDTHRSIVSLFVNQLTDPSVLSQLVVTCSELRGSFLVSVAASRTPAETYRARPRNRLGDQPPSVSPLRPGSLRTTGGSTLTLFGASFGSADLSPTVVIGYGCIPHRHGVRCFVVSHYARRKRL
jgi:hypothetical protein